MDRSPFDAFRQSMLFKQFISACLVGLPSEKTVLYPSETISSEYLSTIIAPKGGLPVFFASSASSKQRLTNCLSLMEQLLLLLGIGANQANFLDLSKHCLKGNEKEPLLFFLLGKIFQALHSKFEGEPLTLELAQKLETLLFKEILENLMFWDSFSGEDKYDALNRIMKEYLTVFQ